MREVRYKRRCVLKRYDTCTSVEIGHNRQQEGGTRCHCTKRAFKQNRMASKCSLVHGTPRKGQGTTQQMTNVKVSVTRRVRGLNPITIRTISMRPTIIINITHRALHYASQSGIIILAVYKYRLKYRLHQQVLYDLPQDFLVNGVGIAQSV